MSSHAVAHALAQTWYADAVWCSGPESRMTLDRTSSGCPILKAANDSRSSNRAAIAHARPVECPSRRSSNAGIARYTRALHVKQFEGDAQVCKAVFFCDAFCESMTTMTIGWIVAALVVAVTLLLYHTMDLAARGEFDDASFVPTALGVAALGIGTMVLLFRKRVGRDRA